MKPEGICTERPRYHVGDVLWVQEPWRTGNSTDKIKPTCLHQETPVYYEGADNAPDSGFGKLRPGRFLPLRFARPARYEVTEVRLERVNEISESDAFNEGCADADPIAAFYRLWNSIYDAPGTRFDDKPWVFAYTFKRIQL